MAAVGKAQGASQGSSRATATAEPSLSVEEITLLTDLWRTKPENLDAKLTELASKIGFEKATLWRATVDWGAYTKAPDSIEALARLPWTNGNPLGINKTRDGPLWTDISMALLIEGANILEPKATSLQWVLISRDRTFTEEQRTAIAGHWVVLPMVKTRTIKVAKTEGAGLTGFRLNGAQWAGRGKDPVITDRSAIFTGIGYDPFHFKEFKSGSGKFRSSGPGFTMNGLTYMVLKGWTVNSKGELNPPTVHKRDHAHLDHVIRWTVNEIIIPAGHAGPDGEFVAPTDEEYLAFALKKFGPHFPEATPPSVVAVLDDAMEAIGGHGDMTAREEAPVDPTDGTVIPLAVTPLATTSLGTLVSTAGTTEEAPTEPTPDAEPAEAVASDASAMPIHLGPTEVNDHNQAKEGAKITPTLLIGLIVGALLFVGALFVIFVLLARQRARDRAI